MRGKPHHLSAEVFSGTVRVVSLTLCTAERAPVFGEPGRAQVVVGRVRRAHERGSRILGYCVMPDHLHVVAVLSNQLPGELVRSVKAGTTATFRRQGFLGDVWQRGYYDRVIRRTDGMLKTLRYVLLNPVRRGLCRRWTEWPFSGSLEWPQLDDGILDDRTLEDAVWLDVGAGR